MFIMYTYQILNGSLNTDQSPSESQRLFSLIYILG